MGKIKFMEVNYKLCHDTIIFHPAYYLNENGEIGIDDEIAQCLEDYFDISKEYWLNMQKKYDYDNQKQIYTTMSDTTCT